MQSYIEWNNNKMYQGHVRRLTQIKQKQKKMLKTLRYSKAKTQGAKSQENIKKQFLPLPLVSKNERILLGSVVKQKTMNLRQKQSLLQNYLLSKRILQTHSVFDSKQLKKQYSFHKKVSQNMNRNLKKNRRTFSELRNKKFQQLQKLKQQNYLGNGKVMFYIKINQIMIIKRVLQDNHQSRYNLIYKPQKFKTYSIRALTFSQLISKKYYFRAHKKLIQKQNGLKFQLEQVRGNNSFKLGQFRLHLQIKGQEQQTSVIQFQDSLNFKNNNTNIQRNTAQIATEHKKHIQKILHPITKYLVGTIQLIVQSKNYFIQ